MDKKKILIIEDSEILAKTLATIFSELVSGCTISFAVDKTEALDFLSKNEFDLITLDGRLLNGDHGREVIKEMDEEQKNKTIVCSFEINFLTECHEKKIDFIHKSGDILGDFEKILKKRKLLN